MLGRGLATAVAVAILDQLGKAAVLEFFAGRALGNHEPVTPFFNLVLTYNRGMSFGLFNDGPGVNAVLFSLVAAAIVAGLIYWLRRVASAFLAIAIGLVIGGAAGNAIDRIVYGAVADFFSFHAGGFEWYVFNIADTAIVAGVVGLLYESLFRGHKKVSNPSKM